MIRSVNHDKSLRFVRYIADIVACWASIIAFIVLFICHGQALLAQSQTGVERLSATSPLAVDAEWIYGVAQDERTLVRKSIAGGAWVKLLSLPQQHTITGLAVSRTHIYFSDGGGQAIHRLEIQTGKDWIIHEGEPLKHPAELASTGDVLVIGDTGTNGLFVLDVDPLGKPTPLDVSKDAITAGPLYLVAFEGGVVMSSPADGSIMQLGRLIGATETGIPVQQLPMIERGRRRSPDSSSLKVTAKSRYPRIAKPGSLAFYRGIVYVINEDDHQVYAFGRESTWPVRLIQTGVEVSNPSRILAKGNDLFILDGSTGEIRRWPRLIPVEVRFELEKSESMTAFYRLLFHSGNLPTRRVALQKNVEYTLRSERVLLGPYVSGLDRLLCALNRPLCSGAKLRPILAEGEPLVIPDLPSESYMAPRQIQLDGTRTLGQEVDRRIATPSLAEWRTEERLRRMNPRFRSKPGVRTGANIRDMRQGTFSIPVELVRYTAAIDTATLYGERFQRLHERYPSMAVIPQEEVRALQEASQEPTSLPSWDEVGIEYDNLLKTIHYEHAPLPNLCTPYIGIAETLIDCGHPDFGQEACMPLPDSVAAVPAGVVVQPPRTIPELRSVRSDSGHGTGVAAAIAARKTYFNKYGLAPQAYLMRLSTDDPAISNDINKAYLAGAHIINISQRVGSLVKPNVPTDQKKLPNELDKVIDGKGEYASFKDVLFIVAAGNEGVEICGQNTIKAYPACWGDRPNVLVVGATNATGISLLHGLTDDEQRKEYGSNWSPTHVHVAAPGEGFHLASIDNSYAPASGTSFAAPLVTATAALLYSQGVIQPLYIKQRIIATSDFKDDLRGHLVAGLLNVHRAVSFPSRTVLIKDNGETPVEVLPGEGIRVQLPAQRPLLLGFKSIRSITATTNGYRIAYVPRDSTEVRFIEDVNPPDQFAWKFHYRVLDSNFAPVGQSMEADVTEYTNIIPALPY